jgi:hypothetical protein
VKTVGGIHTGRAFRISAHVNTDARTVRVTCLIKVSGKIVRAVGHYSAHVASCTGVVPRGTAGKRLAGTITAIISGDRDTKTFSFVIRA